MILKILCNPAINIKKIIFKGVKSFSTIQLRNMTTTHEVKEQTINVGGQTINYVKRGQGPKFLLCFPGALGTIWSDFKPQILDLDPTIFTIIAWDPPGYGKSRPPPRKFSPNFYQNDAEIAFDFMKQLNIMKFSLLGWSDGGVTSMILAAQYPQVIETLVIWGSNAYLTAEDFQIVEKMRDLSLWSERMKAPLIELYTEKGLQDMWNGLCDAFNEIYASGGDICKNSLKSINSPTLILHGDKDPMLAPEHPVYLLENIKNARLHRFPDGKHNIHLRYSEEFNKIVSAFLLANSKY